MKNGVETPLIEVITCKVVPVVVDCKTEVLEFSGEITIEYTLIDLRGLDVGELGHRISFLDKKHISKILAVGIECIISEIPPCVPGYVVMWSVYRRPAIAQFHQVGPMVFDDTGGVKISPEGGVGDSVGHFSLEKIRIEKCIDFIDGSRFWYRSLCPGIHRYRGTDQ